MAGKIAAWVLRRKAEAGRATPVPDGGAAEAARLLRRHEAEKRRAKAAAETPGLDKPYLPKWYE